MRRLRCDALFPSVELAIPSFIEDPITATVVADRARPEGSGRSSESGATGRLGVSPLDANVSRE
jgi:hypothetical protein